MHMYRCVTEHNASRGVLVALLIWLCAFSPANAQNASTRVSNRNHVKPGHRVAKPLPKTPPDANAQKAFLKATDKVKQALDDSTKLSLGAQADVDDLKKLEAADYSQDTIASTIAGMAKDLADTSKQKFIDKLGTDRTALQKKLADWQAAYAPFKPFADRPNYGIKNPVPGLLDALTTFVPQSLAIEKQADADKKLLDDLTSAIKASPGAASKLLVKLTSDLDGLVNTPPQVVDPGHPQIDVIALRHTLVEGLPTLKKVTGVECDLADGWPAFVQAIAGLSDKSITPPTDAKTNLDGAYRTVVARLYGWLVLLFQNSLDLSAQTNNTLRDLLQSPGASNLSTSAAITVDAAVAAKVAKEMADDLDTITTVVGQLVPLLEKDCVKKLVPAEADPVRIADVSQSIHTNSLRLEVVIGKLTADAPVDQTLWVSEAVNVYYFDDIPRLMQVLGSAPTLIGGSADAQTNASQTRKDLEAAAADVVNKRQAVNDARNALAIRQQQLKAAIQEDTAALNAAKSKSDASQRALDAANLRAATASANLTNANNDLTLAKANQATALQDYNNAVTAANANPTDAGLQAQVAAAKRKLDAANAAVNAANQRVDSATTASSAATAIQTAASTRNDAAQAATTAAQTKLTSDQDEQNGLASKVSQAQQDLATATNNLQAAETNTTLDAFIENRAFANARDNVPFWISRPTSPIGSSSNPTERVLLCGFPDSKTLFIRGESEDVERVRGMVMQFDRPQAQAMMTLWTVEMSSQATPRGNDATTNALLRVHDELTVSRVQVDASLALLREVINEVVDTAISQAIYGIQPNNLLKSGAPPSQDLVQQAKTMYPDLVKNYKGMSRSGESEYVDGIPLAALAFYDESVMQRLGWRKDFANMHADTSFLQAVIPSPYGTSTLPQALVILSLAKQEYRREIWQRFHDRIYSRIHNSVSKAIDPKFAASTDWMKDHDASPRFAHLALFLGAIDDNRVSGAGILGFQREIVDALVRDAAPRIGDYILETVKMQREAYSQTVKEIERLNEEYKFAPPEQQARIQAQLNNLQPKMVDASARLKAPLMWLFNTPAGEAGQTKPGSAAAIAENLLKETNEGLKQFELDLHRRFSWYRTANAREAAANEMLKKFTQAIGDDLNSEFVEPMFGRLRQAILKENVSVGIVQRTSVLASNRLVARVDPSASAQLVMGSQENLLEEAQALATLISSAAGAGAQAAAASATGGATTALGAAIGKATPLQTLTSVLGGLDRLPQGTPPGVYGVTTGNLFQITPITDPTGQALRFRFDHVLTSPIREPNNTTNPQLNRIERHGVNTEVQLSNYEIRLISQFDANSQVGLPTRKGGGIPILKDLPILRDIPLIGWFTISKGRAGVVQQDLILGQTQIFPTIGDVIALLTRPITTVNPDFTSSLVGSPSPDTKK